MNIRDMKLINHPKLSLVVLVLFSMVGIACNGGSASNSGSDSGNGDESDVNMVSMADISVPEGFEAIKVSGELGASRHLTVRDNGDIYVRLREQKNGGGIAALRDTDGDGKADQTEFFENSSGTGIGIHKGYLYFSSTTEVKRVPLPEGDKLVPEGEVETVVSGFPQQNQHAAKPITFDNSGNLYVTVGAPSNSCQKDDRTKGSPGMDPCPLLEEHGGIWKFKDDQLNQDHMEDGKHYATGIRHTVSLAWKDNVDKLYAVQHGRDQLSQLFPEYYDAEENAELPAEEFLKVEEGSNFGWPYSYYDHMQDKRVLAPEYGGDGEKVGRASEFDEPILAFPGHWAPNGLTFYQADQFPEKYRDGAFIAWHGSWNRSPKEQQGYKVSFVPFSGGENPSGDYQTFADGFAGQDPLQSPGQAEHRPSGITVGSDGSMYVSSDASGTIWKISYEGS